MYYLKIVLKKRGAPKVEILPELPLNPGAGSEASGPNTSLGSDVSQPDTTSAPNASPSPSEQGSSESSDK